jgi:methionyl-tRNA formyltransferase
VAAYGKLIPNEMLAMAPWGCLNLHFSLLPKYRGASCVATAIRNGESHTGVTIMRIIEKLDAGPILLQEKVEIGPEETTGGLEERLAKIGSELMQKALERLSQGDLAEREQDDSLVSFAPLIRKEEGHIDWKLPAQKIHDLIRGFQPWPAAFTYLDKMRIKVHESKIVQQESENRNQKAGPGEIRKLSEWGIEVACGSGQVLLTEVQPENKRRMKAWDFIQGHHHLLQVGKSFEAAQ